MQPYRSFSALRIWRLDPDSRSRDISNKIFVYFRVKIGNSVLKTCLKKLKDDFHVKRSQNQETKKLCLGQGSYS